MGIKLKILIIIILSIIFYTDFVLAVSEDDLLIDTHIDFPNFLETEKGRKIGMIGEPYIGKFFIEPKKEGINKTNLYLEVGFEYADTIDWQGGLFYTFNYSRIYEPSFSTNFSLSNIEDTETIIPFSITFIKEGTYAIEMYTMNGSEPTIFRRTSFISIVSPITYDNLQKQKLLLKSQISSTEAQLESAIAQKESASATNDISKYTNYLAAATFLLFLGTIVTAIYTKSTGDETKKLAQATSEMAVETSKNAQETSKMVEETSKTTNETSKIANASLETARETSKIANETSKVAEANKLATQPTVSCNIISGKTLLERERANQLNVVIGSPSLKAIEKEKGKKASLETIVILKNHSRYSTRAYVNLNLKVYETLVELDEIYSGKKAWPLNPYQSISGHFSIKDVLEKVNITYKQMEAEIETCEDPRLQLTMISEIRNIGFLEHEIKNFVQHWSYNFQLGKWENTDFYAIV